MFIWNETVVNFIFMVLGSSVLEIFLVIFEFIGFFGVDNLDKDFLGIFIIIGSVVFNFLIIILVCVVSVKGEEVKYIKEFGVFLLIVVWLLWVYIWLLLVV